MPGAHTPRASCRARAERPSSFAVAPAAMLNTITSRSAHVRAAHALRDAPAECGALCPSGRLVASMASTNEPACAHSLMSPPRPQV